MKIPRPPVLLNGYRANFRTLQRASDAGDLCLLSAVRNADSKPVALVCAVNHVNGEFEFAPLAVMIDGNPYELFTPPEA